MHLIKFHIRTFFIIVIVACLACKKRDSPANDTITGDITDTITKSTLFKKYNGNPIFNNGVTQPVWRSLHVANVSILTPDETPDGKWRMFMRGSGNNADGYHDNIGALEQDAGNFNPYMGWTEIAGNPNLKHGAEGTYDALHALDAAAESGPDKEVFIYYMGRDISNRASINGAISTNGGKTFTKFAANPLKNDVGPNDVVYANSKYYLFYGDAKYNGNGFNEPLQIWLSQSATPEKMSSSPTYALKVGAEGSFDSYSVNGAKIFKVTGDSRYFMLYQCSTKNFDYPERFHCAYSTDLITWTKVANTQPLLNRGDAGHFDQGAIWTGSVIENNGDLYIYYEGWGSFNDDSGIRNNVYYNGGNSRVGVATCTNRDFLRWVGNK